MVMLDWTAADLAAWEEEQRKKKEEEERAALGLTAPVYTSPTLAPAETYTPPPPPPPAPSPAPERDSWEVPESAAAGLSSVAEQPPAPEVAPAATPQEDMYQPDPGPGFQWAPEPDGNDLANADGLNGFLNGQPVAPEWYDAHPGALNPAFTMPTAPDLIGPPAPSLQYNTSMPLDTSQVDDQRNAPPPPVRGGMMLGGLGLVDDNGVPIDPSMYQQFGFGAEGKPLNSASAAILSNPNFAESNAQFDATTNPANREGPGVIRGLMNIAGGINDVRKNAVDPALGAVQDTFADTFQTAGNALYPYGKSAPTPSGFSGGTQQADNLGGDITREVVKGIVPGNTVEAALNFGPDAAFSVAPEVLRGLKAIGAADQAGEELKPVGIRALQVAARKFPQTPEFASDVAPIRNFLRPATAGGAAEDLSEWERAISMLSKTPDERAAAETAFKAAESQRMVQEAADKATMFQRVGHDTKTLRNRAAQVAERLEKLKAAAADETGAIRLPGAADNVVEELPGTQLSAPLNELPTTGTQVQFGEGFAPDKPSALQRFADNVKAIPSAMKSVQTSGDVFGFQARQGAPSAFIDPKAWGKNFPRMYKAYIEDPAAKAAMEGLQAEPRFTTGELLTTATKAPVIDPATGKQIVIKPMAEVMETFKTPGMEKINDSLVSNIAENFPLSKRSEKSMRIGYLGLANDLRNSMIDDAVRAGVTDQSYYDHFNDIAKITVGYGDVPEKLKAFSDGFYSLRNIAARFQMMTKPFTEPGALLDVRLPGSSRAGKFGGVFAATPRGVAARNASRFALGELANLRLLAAGGAATGLYEVGWNPLESGFGALQFIDNDGNTFSTDLLGGWGSYIKMMSRTAAAVNGDDKFDPFDEQVKFWRYKAGPVPSTIIDTIVANSDLKDLKGFDSPFSKPITDIKNWKPSDFAENFTPFFASAGTAPLLDGVLDVKKPDDLLKVGGLLSAAFAGSPTSMYEPSSYSLAPQMFDGKQYEDLNGAQRAQINLKLLDQGAKLEGWQRVSPYDRADDDAFAKIKAANPELAKYKDLPSLRDDLERQIIAKAEQEGITLESQEVDTKRQALEKKLGIDKYTEPLHALVVATDPGIVAEMQKMYDAKDRTFPPSKKWREFAAAVEKMSEAERKDLIKQLQERLDAAP